MLGGAVQQPHELKFTLFYHGMGVMATVSAVRGKKFLTNGHICSLITKTDSTKNLRGGSKTAQRIHREFRIAESGAKSGAANGPPRAEGKRETLSIF